MSGIERMTAKYIKLLKRLKGYISFRIKLFEMDWWFYFLGINGWKLFPPSFYYTHTKEEVKVITEETVNKLKEMLET